MLALDLEQKLSDLIAFQCVLVALRGSDEEASDEMLWQTLLGAFVDQYGFRRAWYGRLVNGAIRPWVSAPVAESGLADLPLEVASDSPLVAAAGLDLPVRVETEVEGRLIVETENEVSPERAEQVSVLLGEAAATLRQRRARRRNEAAVQQARLRAEAADHAKTVMLANMSHEIRTPMSGIIGFADLLAATPLSSDQQDYVENIRSSADALLALINDILDLSKIEAGRLELESAPVDLRRLVENVVGLLAARAAEKRLRLAFTIDPSTPATIVTDAARLRQVLVNLLGNAVKFTSQGGVSLSVAATKEIDGRHHIDFAVSDTGPGIAPEHLELIFESFRQVDASISRRFGGTGLGLAISRSIVRQMGGAIKVESQVGHGATFRFSIPASAAARSEVATLRRPAIAGARASGLPALRLLVAEDNAVNRKLAQAVLRQLGYQPDFAVNGVEACDRVALHDYDLVLMDVQMPEMDGLEATRRIRRECPPARQPRIVAMTAAAFPEDRNRCLDAGMDDYVSKPIDMEELIAALRRVPAANRQLTAPSMSV
ncbi:MAG: ATP-binding protein [Bryobacteraceae bacterium]|jgi:signal transduction histidine kinase/ActR/RegA family two-component response regulator